MVIRLFISHFTVPIGSQSACVLRIRYVDKRILCSSWIFTKLQVLEYAELIIKGSSVWYRFLSRKLSILYCIAIGLTMVSVSPRKMRLHISPVYFTIFFFYSFIYNCHKCNFSIVYINYQSEQAFELWTSKLFFIFLWMIFFCILPSGADNFVSVKNKI